MSEIVRSIVAKASTLWERLDGSDYVPCEGTASGDVVGARFRRWQERVGKGTVASWEKRIRWSGWSRGQIDAVLGSVQLAENAPLPAWAYVLQKIMDCAPDFADRGTEAHQTDGKEPTPIPFRELLLPCVAVAQKLLRERCVERGWVPDDFLSDSAIDGLRRPLLSSLSTISAQTFLDELSARRTAGHNLLLSMTSPDPANASTDIYRSFVRDSLGDRYQVLFERYPVLARLVATKVCGYVDALEEFLCRFAADQDALAAGWPDLPQGSRKISELRMDVADVHAGGRTVIIVAFDTGQKIVYKPRSLGAEAAWFGLRTWCRERGLFRSDTDIRILERDGYGWMDFAEHRPCCDSEEVASFYHDAGTTLALLYVLGGTDFHWENLIASGPDPVLIDLETMMTPRLALTMQGQEDDELEEGFFDSVLRTGMLPNWTVDRRNGGAVDISGLCGGVEGGSSVRRPVFRSVNTDDMHLVLAERTLPAQKNLPTLAGQAVKPGEYLPELLGAFGQAYRFLLQHREDLLTLNSLADGLRRVQLRHVYRATRIYATLLQRTYQPEFMGDGTDRSIELDVMSWNFLQDDSPSVLWPVASAEINSLEQMDVPVFHVDADELDLRPTDAAPIEDAFASFAWDLFLNRLARMDDADLQLQSGMIRGAFAAHGAGRNDAKTILHGKGPQNPPRLPSSEELLGQAIKIGERLLKDELPGRNGDALWLGLDYLPVADRYQFKPLDEGLYNGSSGIALFLSALYRVTGDDRYRRAALRGVNRLRRRAEHLDLPLVRRWADRRGIGLSSGLAGGVFALLRLGLFLRDDALVADAVALSSLIDPARISMDSSFDVIGGSAGTLLVLAGLYDQTRDADVLERAVACGDHLLRNRSSSGSGRRLWKTIGEKPFTGYSHGMSGIADALLRLADRSGEERFLEAARDAFAYETEVYLPDRKNWPDFRGAEKNGDVRCADQWCHGAAGIGFARLSARALITDPGISADLDIALASVAGYGVGTVDDLCCGNMGRIDFLFTAARVSGRQDLHDAALEAAALILDEAERRGGFRLLDSTFGDAGIPGLFKGLAGIGYQLLRLALPADVPSILMFGTSE